MKDKKFTHTDKIKPRKVRNAENMTRGRLRATEDLMEYLARVQGVKRRIL